MPLTRPEIVDLYRRRARRYDLTANLYYLIGFRENAFRRRAVEALALRPGDTVVELGCGTGLNFRYLQEAVGPDGRIVGVELTDAMLERAERRARSHGWNNVELVRGDMATAGLPPRVDGVLSTFALSLVPQYDAVIERSVHALVPGGRLAVLDLKAPEGVPRWLLRFGLAITRPFGVTRDYVETRPWEGIRRSLERHAARMTWTELYFGFAFLATAHAASAR